MSLNILVVEDERDIVKVYQLVFPKYGLKIISVAYDGNEAVQEFKKNKEQIDLIVMDHRMPGKTGLEAAREILAIDNKAKIVFGSADIQVRDAALALGVKVFLKKPFDMKEIVAGIKKMICNGSLNANNGIDKFPSSGVC